MTIKVLMLPHLSHFRSEESGIKTVVTKYFEHLPKFDIELVDPGATTFDVKAAHAGMTGADATVSHCHGLYWTGDYDAAAWEWKSNQAVIDSLRGAKEVTVPSEWVAEALRRDMHLNPHVINHGVDWHEWQHNEPNEGYILGFAKNRTGDVCDPAPMTRLANLRPNLRFMGTFATVDAPPNVKATGLVKHLEMRRMVQRSAVFVNTTKESGGIAILEAMASGIPVLGYKHGGILDFVHHGVNGYLARPGDIDDLAAGLDYCLKHRATLGANGRELVKMWTWESVCEQVAQVFRLAAEPEPATVSVVIPVYNKTPEQLSRAIESAMAQTYEVEEIIVVDDGSDNSAEISSLTEAYPVSYFRQPNKGVGHARNAGISRTYSKYVCCLDADDWIAPQFIEACIAPLEADRTLGVAYTRLMAHMPDGREILSDWPGQFNYDNQIRRRNQIPTCAVFRREAWERSGGYRQRYAPSGAGAEDAAFWTHVGALGFGAVLATEEPLFHYSAGAGHTAKEGYREPDWLGWYPWAKDEQHPFASVATPKFFSHPVRQYDEPVVSVIIPVGPNHQQYLSDALDSLEAQTFRRWEAIVVFDGGNEWLPEIHGAYPFIRHTNTKGRGAGHARNVGTMMARAPFLLFLDADDWLQPTAIERLLDGWNTYQAGIYSDYYGCAVVDDVAALAPNLQGNIEQRNERTKETIIRYYAKDYDWQRAQDAPENPPYLWCNVTTLIPKSWHTEIGGFDESMQSWEDVDYWYRLAMAGKPFARIEEPLLTYRFHTGQRRESGRQLWDNLLSYMRGKYERITKMACGSCGQKRSVPEKTIPEAATRSLPAGQAPSSDGDFVLSRLTDGNRGDHPIVGMTTKIKYGYRSDGDVFLVHKDDIAAQPGKFERVVEGIVKPEVEPTEAPEPVLIAVGTMTEPVPAEEPKRKPGRPKKS